VLSAREIAAIAIDHDRLRAEKLPQFPILSCFGCVCSMHNSIARREMCAYKAPGLSVVDAKWLWAAPSKAVPTMSYASCVGTTFSDF